MYRGDSDWLLLLRCYCCWAVAAAIFLRFLLAVCFVCSGFCCCRCLPNVPGLLLLLLLFVCFCRFIVTVLSAVPSSPSWFFFFFFFFFFRFPLRSRHSWLKFRVLTLSPAVLLKEPACPSPQVFVVHKDRSYLRYLTNLPQFVFLKIGQNGFADGKCRTLRKTDKEVQCASCGPAWGIKDCYCFIYRPDQDGERRESVEALCKSFGITRLKHPVYMLRSQFLIPYTQFQRPRGTSRKYHYNTQPSTYCVILSSFRVRFTEKVDAQNKSVTHTTPL